MTITRRARSWGIATSLCVLIGTATPARAALRSPQVAVSGTALQSFFASQLQAINAVGSQLDVQRFSVPVGAALQVRSFATTGGSFGAYNASLAAPSLYQLYPGSAGIGWYVVGSFRTLPDRLVVNLFDAGNVSQGSTTYLGADRTDFAFYAQDVAGTFYAQDARNPGAAPRILAYAGTGVRTGSTWFACETGAGPGGDFADLIMLVDMGSSPVHASPTCWGRVKALYNLMPPARGAGR